ncbi:DNA repair protein RecO C-terminal domain-containing protein, partial [Patescibacteria group bacterium]
FVWKLLVFSGYKPEFNKCAFCGNKTSENMYLGRSQGGLFCKSCFSCNPDMVKIGKNAIDYLKGRTVKVEKIEEIILVIQKFMRIHLDKVLKSEVWVDKLFNVS